MAPVASTSKAIGAGPAKPGPSKGKGTDGIGVEGLGDLVSMAGFSVEDLHREEAEAARMRAAARRDALAQVGYSRIARDPVLVDKENLKAQVIKFAAQYELRYLEPDTLPMIGLAVQQRLRSIIEAMRRSRDHRIASAPEQPPPTWLSADGTTDTGAPMWDEVIYDDVETVLATYDRVEREHERTERIARAAREEKEREEAANKAMEEAAAAAAASAASDADGPPRKKQKKAISAAQQAKSVTEDVQKRLGDATAARKLGATKQYSWLQQSGPPTSGLSRPPSVPGSPSVPAPPATAPAQPSKLGLGQAGANLAQSDRYAAPSAPHAATAMADPHLLTWPDALFTLDTERGTGAGYGSGTRPLYSALATRHLGRRF